MRLRLRRKLEPFGSIEEIALALNITRVEAQRRIRKLERDGTLNLATLVGDQEPVDEKAFDQLSMTFYRHQRCLVCGNPLERIQKGGPGWGEFFGCDFCDFAAHENEHFAKLKETAAAQLNELREGIVRAQSVFSERRRNRETLLNR